MAILKARQLSELGAMRKEGAIRMRPMHLDLFGSIEVAGNKLRPDRVFIKVLVGADGSDDFGIAGRSR
jgi:hypothetical protein